MSEASDGKLDREALVKRLEASPPELIAMVRTLVEAVMTSHAAAQTEVTGLIPNGDCEKRVDATALRILETYYPGLVAILLRKNAPVDGKYFNLMQRVQQDTPVLSMRERVKGRLPKKGAAARASGESATVNRGISEYLAVILNELGIDLKECIAREEPESGNECTGSKMIYIPSIKKLIFINDRSLVATFIIHSVEPDDVNQFNGIKISKLWALRGDGKVSYHVWAKKEDEKTIKTWKEKLKAMLQAEKGEPWEVNNVDPDIEMGEEYFQDREAIAYDLQAFMTASGSKSVFDLTTHNFWSLRVHCFNGEVVSGSTYFYKAAKAYGYEKKGKLTNTLQKLLETAGYVVHNKEYFLNPKNCKTDMEAFLAQYNAGREGTPCDSISDLKYNQVRKLVITCANGESVTGNEYFGRAAKAFGYKKDYRRGFEKILEIAAKPLAEA